MSVLAVLLWLSVGGLVPGYAAARDDVEVEAAAAIQTQLDADRVPAAAYAVLGPNGVTVGSRGAGIGSQTPFVLGSISKSFTALAVLQLVDAGKVELQAPVQRYLPDFRSSDAETAITVEQLLTQTSGLPTSAGLRIVEHPEESLEQRVAAVDDVDLQSVPDSTFNYSNINYAILGSVVEQVTGQGFADYVQQSIFGPLGMNDSFTSMDEARRHGLVPGSTVWFGNSVHQSMPDYPGGLPDGFLVSTARDMGRYLQFQLGDGRWQGTRIISEENLLLMHTTATKTEPDTAAAGTDGYGMGWATGRIEGQELLAHDGDTVGYHDTMALLPQANSGLVVLTARNGALTSPGAAYNAGLVVLAGGPPPPTSHAFLITYGIVDLLCGGLVVLLVTSLIRRRWTARQRARIERYGPVRGITVPVLRNLLLAGLVWGAVFYAVGFMLLGVPLSVRFAFGFIAPDLTLIVLLLVVYFLIRATISALAGIRILRTQKPDEGASN